MPPTPVRASLALVLLTAACGSSPSVTTDAGVDVPRDVSVTDVTDVTDAREGCTTDPADRRDGSVCITRVVGRAETFEGTPLANHSITFCGPACFIGNTDADGRFSVPVREFLLAEIYSVQVHGRPNHASLYLAPVPRPVDGTVTLPAALRVPEYTATGPAVPEGNSGGSVTAGDLTLTFAPDSDVTLDLEDFDLGELGTRLRVATVPVEQAPPFARGQGLVLLRALAPFALTATRPIAVTIRDAGGLAPNTPVDFVALGHDILSEPPTAGTALVVGTGRVSADGASVSTDPGQGPTVLTWIGVRPRRE